jgi:hypothetical protein
MLPPRYDVTDQTPEQKRHEINNVSHLILHRVNCPRNQPDAFRRIELRPRVIVSIDDNCSEFTTLQIVVHVHWLASLKERQDNKRD